MIIIELARCIFISNIYNPSLLSTTMAVDRRSYHPGIECKASHTGKNSIHDQNVYFSGGVKVVNDILQRHASSN
jgi:hypothetical protein